VKLKFQKLYLSITIGNGGHFLILFKKKLVVSGEEKEESFSRPGLKHENLWIKILNFISLSC